MYGSARLISRFCFRRQTVSVSVPARSLFSFTSSEERRRKDLEELSLEEIRELVELEEAEEEEEEDGQPPWRALLEPAARASWRTSDQKPPRRWVEIREAILDESERTNKQLRRTHHRALESQKALADRRERERRRQRQFKKLPPDSLAEKHEREKDTAASPVYYKPESTFAALNHRFLPNFAIVKRVLLEAQALLPDFQPKKVLDYGIGVGSSSAAAMDVFPEIDWIHGIDCSRSMRDCATKVLQDRGPRITTDVMISTKSVGGNFDLCLFAYTATEMTHVAATLAAAAVLWEKLAPNGLFVMIEPGTPDGFSNIRSVRSMLLDCCPPDEDERDEDGHYIDQCHIIAPCTHNCECPMERHKLAIRPKVEGDDDAEEEQDYDGVEEAEWNDDSPGLHPLAGFSETDAFSKGAYCSFVHNIPGSKESYKGDKLSYFVAQKRYPGIESQPSSHPFQNLNVTELLAETYRSSGDRDPVGHEIILYEAGRAQEKFDELGLQDPLGLSILIGDDNRKSFGRIVRAPIKKKGHIIVDYCAAGPEGKGRIIRHRLGKAANSKVAPGQYAAARKARWGGLWPNVFDKIQ
jgi:ribosomal protein RSM22 (predicted rRNA methylase)